MAFVLDKAALIEKLDGWREALNALAGVTGVPAALIMRIDGPLIEVLVSSDTEGNPYKPGNSEEWEDSGLYCERVVRMRQPLLVPNALDDPRWDHNPDIRLNMISYLGFPLILPDGQVFGTICILDNKENQYTGAVFRLMEQYKRLIETDFKLHYERQALHEALQEIKTLQSLLPICSHCKKIRDDEGLWKQMEDYLFVHHHMEFTHTLCQDCLRELYPDLQTE